MVETDGRHPEGPRPLGRQRERAATHPTAHAAPHPAAHATTTHATTHHPTATDVLCPTANATGAEAAALHTTHLRQHRHAGESGGEPKRQRTI